VKKGRVLAVDDEVAITRLLARALEQEGFEIVEAADLKAARRHLDRGGVGLILCDLYLGRESGLDLLKETRASRPDVPFVLMTGQADMETVVEAIQAGAFDYMTKPVDLQRLSAIAKRALQPAAREDAEAAATSAAMPKGMAGLVGRSPAMVDVYKLIARAAALDSPVLIEGESGTGKELAARALHFCGPRSSRPFVPINCAAVPEGLLESELFGHMRGAFTGASADKAGLFREASGGTVFLDEIGEMPAATQAKLLRVLDERRVRPLGSEQETQVDVRVVAATNRPLAALAGRGEFRSDLFYRLDVLRLSIPPLRHRPEDVPLLVEHFVAKLNARGGRAQVKVTPEAVRRLAECAWPGNVRELAAALERAAASSPTKRLTEEDFEYLPRAPAEPVGGLRSLDEVEGEHIRRVMEQVGGNRSRAAEILGIDRKTLARRLGSNDL